MGAREQSEFDEAARGSRAIDERPGGNSADVREQLCHRLSSEASGSCSPTGYGRPRSTSATDASWPFATTPSARPACASWTPAISSSCRVSSTRTCTSTILAAPIGKASSTRRRPPRRAASRRSSTCRSTASRRQRTSRDWRRNGAPRRGGAMSTSGSGAVSCPATALRSSRSPVPACSASSVSCHRPAWRSSPTSANRISARRCRSSRGSACRSWRTLSGRRSFAIRRETRGGTRRGSTAGHPRASLRPSPCSCGWRATTACACISSTWRRPTR